MEESTFTSNPEIKSIELLPEGVAHLNEARRWSHFLSIMGFIGTGFLVIAAFFVGALLSLIGDESIPGGLGIAIGVIYLVLAVVYFFPVLYLFKFSTKAKMAVNSSDKNLLSESIGFLKSHYKFIGIMTIVMLIAYPLLVVILMVGGIMTAL